jgi:thymidylate synthase
MRFYQNFAESLNEIKRELKEMGIEVCTKSVQNKDISDNADFKTMEIQNYVYLVTNPDPTLIPKDMLDEQWCVEEFKERIGGLPINPGNAWRLRKAYWEQFLNKRGKFDYTYPERMSITLQRVIDLLRQDPMSRRAYFSIFDAVDDQINKLDVRVPCSLGYHFMYRQGKLNVTYFLRSSDYFEHLGNDLWLASSLLYHVAEQCNMPVGHFCHHVGSLHCFQHNVKDVF